MIRPAQKDLYAVVGNPVGHSLSPVMMNALFDSLNIPAAYVALQSDSLEEDLETLSRMGFKGLSVTIPHKETALKTAVRTDETARAIGAVNTLRLAEDGWEGRNTDWKGSNLALGGPEMIRGKSALVVGAGGAARAVAYGLKRDGARVVMANRSVPKGEAVAAAFGCEFIPLPEIGNRHDYDIVVQCTSLGLAGGENRSPLPASFFRPGMKAMDIVYRPQETPFLRDAARSGCTVVPGIDMLLLQGVAQLRWWLEREIPPNGIAAMRNALTRTLSHE